MFVHAVSLRPRRGLSLTSRTSGFVDDVMFSLTKWVVYRLRASHKFSAYSPDAATLL